MKISAKRKRKALKRAEQVRHNHEQRMKRLRKRNEKLYGAPSPFRVD